MPQNESESKSQFRLVLMARGFMLLRVFVLAMATMMALFGARLAFAQDTWFVDDSQNDGLLAHWRMDENAGTFVRDFVGSAHGTIISSSGSPFTFTVPAGGLAEQCGIQCEYLALHFGDNQSRALCYQLHDFGVGKAQGRRQQSHYLRLWHANQCLEFLHFRRRLQFEQFESESTGRWTFPLGRLSVPPAIFRLTDSTIMLPPSKIVVD